MEDDCESKSLSMASSVLQFRFQFQFQFQVHSLHHFPLYPLCWCSIKLVLILSVTVIPFLTDRSFADETNCQVNQWLKHRYDHLPLLRVCADPDVTTAMIQEFTQVHGTAALHQTDDDHGLTPLHVLTLATMDLPLTIQS